MICKTPCYGVLFRTFDLCGCWEQPSCLFQPKKKKQASEATAFLCRDFNIQETTSNPGHHSGASWNVGNPRVHPSPREGPSKPAGTTLENSMSLVRNTERGRQLGALLMSSPRKRKAFTFPSSQLVLKSEAMIFGLPVVVSVIHEIPILCHSCH